MDWSAREAVEDEIRQLRKTGGCNRVGDCELSYNRWVERKLAINNAHVF